MAAGPPDQMPSRFVQEGGGGESRRNRPVSEAWLRYLDSTLNPPARGRPRTRTGGLADAPDVPSRRDGGARPAPCPPHVRPRPVLPSPPLRLPSPSPIALGREGSMACTSLFPCAAEGALRRRGAQQQTGRARRRRHIGCAVVWICSPKLSCPHSTMTATPATRMNPPRPHVQHS